MFCCKNPTVCSSTLRDDRLKIKDKTKNLIGYIVGVTVLGAGGYYLYRQLSHSSGSGSTGPVTVTVQDNGSAAPFASVNSTPAGISGTCDNNGTLQVFNIPYGNYTVTASYTGLVNSGSVNVSNPVNNSVTIDLIQSSTLSVTIVSGSAVTTGMVGTANISGAPSGGVVVDVTGLARNSLGQTIGLGTNTFNATNGTNIPFFATFNSPIPSGSYTFQFNITTTSGSALGTYSWTAQV